MQTKNSNTRKWLWLTLLLTGAIVLIVQLPLLLEAEYVDEDLRFFYWLYRLSDPSLFEADSLLGYQFAEVNIGSTTLLFNKVSLLYGTLYAALSHFFSPFIFSKLLIFPLALISSYYLFRIGERITDPFTAFILTMVFTIIVAVPYSPIALASGLPRAFGLPLLLAMLFYLMNDNYLGMAVVLVMGLFYPPAFLTILLTYGVKVAYESIKRRQLALNGRQVAFIAAALLLSLLLLLPALTTGLNTVPSDSESAQQVSVYASPLFGENGRYPLLWPQPLTANGGLVGPGLVGLLSFMMTLFLIPIALVLRRQFNPLPAAFWYLALASLIGFVLSWLAILLLPSAIFHMPNRYPRGTIFIMCLTLIIVNGPRAIQSASSSLAASRGGLGWLLGATTLAGLALVLLVDLTRTATIVVGLLVLLVVILTLVIHRRSRSSAQSEIRAPTAQVTDPAGTRRTIRLQTILVAGLLLLMVLFYVSLVTNKFHRPDAAMKELLAFSKTLPDDSLIGGYPCFLDDVPLYSQRKVLFSCEIESRDMSMMKEALDVYFAESMDNVLGFCQRYDVDYMVASRDTFSEEFRDREQIIFEPLNSSLKQQLSGRDSFALDRVPDESKIFQNDAFYVFPCTADALAAAE